MFSSAVLFSSQSALLAFDTSSLLDWLTGAKWIAIGTIVAAAAFWLTTRYIPHNYVGIVEKLWSPLGSVADGQIIALSGEAGFQADILRGGLHFGLWRWQYKVHKTRLVTIAQGKIGYVYARDGEPLPPSQTLARAVASNNFQDARAFLNHIDVETSDVLRGQRGRQRAILREGVYAINLAVFVVITDDTIYALPALQSRQEIATIIDFQQDLQESGGFDPVLVGGRVEAHDALDPTVKHSVDSIAIVTVHDGPSLVPGEIIAPMVGVESAAADFHNNFQDPEAFLAAGGCRGRQLQTLTDGTYFINRWFATVELIPKTVVPIGYVGVVVSYHGRAGQDVSGKGFRHGEQVADGERGVWERALGPGKYPFNTYAGNILLVPTTNFVLHWITGKAESHRYDESLRSIDLVTKDAYEPLLPLSVVVHIDYQRAPSVIQRFGDVKKLITQTLDPMLSAYFRDIAHKKTMLALLHERDEIQLEAREELRRKFREFDIECVDVLIGKPQTVEGDDKIETLLEQLRQRQLSTEQLETYERRRTAAEKLRELNAAQAQADMQTALTNARVQAQIAESQGEADLARARKQAEQTVVVAEAALARARREAEQKVVTAEADSRERILAGRGESQRIMQVGLSEASVLLRKIASFGDPRLFAISRVAEHLSHSKQPLVPERMFIAGASGENGKAQAANGLVGLLVSLMVAEKSGFAMADTEETKSLREFADRMTAQVMQSLEHESAQLSAIASRTGNGEGHAVPEVRR
jgi:uncharacterized membrane protein YqiK